jgi:hypothetical protein
VSIRGPAVWVGIVAVSVALMTASAANATERTRAAATSSSSIAAYVALGDSIASGGGNMGTGWVNWSGTTGGNADDGCDRSPVGYPMLVDSWLSSRQVTPPALSIFACSGATSSDLDQESPATYLGLHGQTNDFGEALQFSHTAELASAALITVTIGANDVDFYGDALHCHDEPRQCTATSSRSWIAKLHKNITGLGLVLAPTFTTLRKLAPNARIVVVQYPSLFPPANKLTSSEWENGCSGFTGATVRYLTEGQWQLNAAISRRSRAAGFTVVDPDTGRSGFVGGDHTLCGKSEWLFGRQLSGSYHPNKMGQAALARAVEAALKAASVK